jgi:hypothetical protein
MIWNWLYHVARNKLTLVVALFHLCRDKEIDAAAMAGLAYAELWPKITHGCKTTAG